MNLHNEIMNLQQNKDIPDLIELARNHSIPINAGLFTLLIKAYRIGFRDARHKAAELVNQKELSE